MARSALFATAGLALAVCAALLFVVMSPSAVRRTSALQLEEVLPDGRVVQLRERQEPRPMMVEGGQSVLWQSQVRRIHHSCCVADGGRRKGMRLGLAYLGRYPLILSV